MFGKLPKDKEKEREVTKTETKEEPVYTRTALGTFKENGLWYLATFRFNPETGEVSELVKSGPGDIKDVIMEKFKIAAVHEEII